MKPFEKMTTATLKNQLRAAISITGNRQRLVDLTSGILKGMNKKS